MNLTGCHHESRLKHIPSQNFINPQELPLSDLKFILKMPRSCAFCKLLLNLCLQNYTNCYIDTVYYCYSILSVVQIVLLAPFLRIFFSIKMACYGCARNFSLLNRESACAKCGFGFCSGCLKHKAALSGQE